MCLEVQRTPGGRCASQGHALVWVPHRPGFRGGHIPFSQHMRRLGCGHDLRIVPLRPVFLLASIQTTAFALVRGEDLLEIGTAELPRGLHGTIVLLAGRVPEACFSVLSHPGRQRLLLLVCLLWSTGICLA